jgi:hypothetical protein
VRVISSFFKANTIFRDYSAKASWSLGYTSDQAMVIFGVAMGMTLPLLYIPSNTGGSLSDTLIPELSSAVFAQNYFEVNRKNKFCNKICGFHGIYLYSTVLFAGISHWNFLLYNLDAGYFLDKLKFSIVQYA